jgi:hypothetical protein
MMKKTLITLVASLLLPLAATHAVEVENLRCEYLKDPLGVDVAKPRLSWKLETGDLKPERGRPPYTSDPAPHWGCNFVYWDGYQRFWSQALAWLLDGV